MDDILLTGYNLHLITTIKDQLHKEFSIKDSGSLNYYLGIEFLRSSQGIQITQRKYALALLHDADLHNSKPVSNQLMVLYWMTHPPIED